MQPQGNREDNTLFFIRRDAHDEDFLLCLLLSSPCFTAHALRCYTDIEATQITRCKESEGFRTCFTKYNDSKFPSFQTYLQVPTKKICVHKLGDLWELLGGCYYNQIFFNEYLCFLLFFCFFLLNNDTHPKVLSFYNAHQIPI